MDNSLTDAEKQQLLAVLYVHKVHAPGLDQLALRVAESISGMKEREFALLKLSYYLAAYRNFALAEEVARQRLKGYARASGLATIGAEIAINNPDSAVRFLQDAETLLSEVSDSDEQAILLQQISRGYIALKNWQKATELANRVSPAQDKVSTLCEIAGALWEVSELETANQTLAEARAVVNETDLGERTGALNDVAKILVQMHRATEAIRVWDEAITFADHSAESSKWLFSICERLISLGNLQRASEVALLIKNDARRKQVFSLIGEA